MLPIPTSFFEDHAWLHRFDDEVLFLGKKLSSPRFLTRLALRATDDGYLLTGEADSFGWEVDLWPEGSQRWGFETSCHCDHGTFCPHAAAGLFRASRPNTLARLLREKDHAPSFSPSPAPPSPSAPEPFDGLPIFRLTISEEPADHRVVQLLLQALKIKQRDTWLVARATVQYGPHLFPLTKNSATSPIVRDKAAEFRALEELTQLGLTNLTTNPTYRFLLSLAKKQSSDLSVEGCWFPDPQLSSPNQYWPWFRAKGIAALQKSGWELEIDPNFGHHLHLLSDENLTTSLELAPGGWFTLSVGIDLDGRRLDLLPILTALLDSETLDQLSGLDENEPHLVYLPGGGALQIPAGRLRTILHHLANLTDPKRPTLHPIDAAALIEDAPFPLDPPTPLVKLRESLRRPESLPSEFSPPAGLQATLRDYQKTGADWMTFLAAHELNGILADDMGLGKTMQTLTHFLRLKESKVNGSTLPALVVAPTSVVSNWANEAKKFAPSLRTLILHGAQRKKLLPHIPHADLVLTSYALLQRDVERLKKFSFEIIVLDEAQHIKNPRAKVSQAACALSARNRLCLSGTPVENNLGELWSLFRFLMPGFLGSLERFREHYQHPIEKDDDEVKRNRLRARLRPLILRRTKDEVATELPPKTILVHPIDLTTGQRDLYETVRATMDKEVRQAIAARGLEQSQFAILDALLKLRQICCHPSLLKLPSAQTAKAQHSAKLDYLFELLDTLFAEGRRVLLFSQFTSMLALIEAGLKLRKIPYLILTGSSKDRGSLVLEFQSRPIPIFLISLKAGGTGLTLTAADTVIHYDPWWNPAAENQATDRAYRIGQDKPVFVHKLICSGTVEDRIHQLQQKKAHLADSLLMGASKAIPNQETLQHLLAPLED